MPVVPRLFCEDRYPLCGGDVFCLAQSCSPQKLPAGLSTPRSTLNSFKRLPKKAYTQRHVGNDGLPRMPSVCNGVFLMLTQARAATLFAATIALASCGHSSTLPAASTNSNDLTQTQSVIKTNTGGTFVQYALPAGVNPADLAHGPYGTLWFTASGDASHIPPLPARVFRMITTSGNVRGFTVPNPPGTAFSNGPAGIVSTGGFVFFVVVEPQSENTDFFTRISNDGVSDLFVDTSDSPYSNFAVGSDGNIWYTTCGQGDCSEFASLRSRTTSGAGGAGALLPPLEPHAVTAGPGGNIYVAGVLNGFPNPCDDCGAVDVFSTSGAKLHEFTLPVNSAPASIVTGSDHNLWILEQGINKIARMTPSGVVTQFSIPTANAGVARITYGWDQALWFTENNADKVGRITTAGVVTEYPIPVANARPNGIVTCAATSCPPDGGVWF